MKVIGEVTDDAEDEANCGTEMTTFSIKSTQVEFQEEDFSYSAKHKG